MTEFQDKTLTCQDCGADFVFSAGEQDFYNKKGFENEPLRCPSCRSARKRGRHKNGSYQKSFEPLVEVVCDECGAVTKVPFKPTQGKPVYCRECYEKRKTERY